MDRSRFSKAGLAIAFYDFLHGADGGGSRSELALFRHVRQNSRGIIGATANMTVLGIVSFLPFNSYQQVVLSLLRTLLIYVKDTHPPHHQTPNHILKDFILQSC